METIFDFVRQEFEGNTDGINIKLNEVPFPLQTSEVIVFPTEWHKNIAVRFELYGCKPGKHGIFLMTEPSLFYGNEIFTKDFSKYILENKRILLSAFNKIEKIAVLQVIILASGSQF